jgi:hypothetical protein
MKHPGRKNKHLPSLLPCLPSFPSSPRSSFPLSLLPLFLLPLSPPSLLPLLPSFPPSLLPSLPPYLLTYHPTSECPKKAATCNAVSPEDEQTSRSTFWPQSVSPPSTKAFTNSSLPLEAALKRKVRPRGSGLFTWKLGSKRNVENRARNFSRSPKDA